MNNEERMVEILKNIKKIAENPAKYFQGKFPEWTEEEGKTAGYVMIYGLAKMALEEKEVM